MSSRTIISTTAAPAALGPYSQAVKHEGLLYCSGSIPLQADGSRIDSSPAAEARQCLENLNAVCVASATSLDRALKVTIYTTALESSAQINEAYDEHFGEEPPARVMIGVAALPKDVRIEIEAIVAVD